MGLVTHTRKITKERQVVERTHGSLQGVSWSFQMHLDSSSLQLILKMCMDDCSEGNWM